MTGPFDLTGRVAVVTGGNRGIGRAAATGLAAAGAHVVILGRDETANAVALSALAAAGASADAEAVDIADERAVARTFGAVVKRHGRIDVLVNSAGISDLTADLLDDQYSTRASDAAWGRVLDVNVSATFAVSQHAARTMRERGNGSIIMLASLYSLYGSAVSPAYSVSKGATVSMTRSMAVALAPAGVRVNAVMPGWITTDLTAPLRSPEWAEAERAILARTPMARWGRPEEVAGTIVYLASDAASFVTGAVIAVDGGYSAA
jgi:NAD(P)-dependent dehydrogenase (short-subunit alcohol dehydrogenase family)